MERNLSQSGQMNQGEWSELPGGGSLSDNRCNPSAASSYNLQSSHIRTLFIQPAVITNQNFIHTTIHLFTPDRALPFNTAKKCDIQKIQNISEEIRSTLYVCFHTAEVVLQKSTELGCATELKQGSMLTCFTRSTKIKYLRKSVLMIRNYQTFLGCSMLNQAQCTLKYLSHLGETKMFSWPFKGGRVPW